MSAQPIPLPPAVEQLLETVSREKSKSPAHAVARKFLAEIGEEASLGVLNSIRNSNTQIRNLSGYIVHLVKQRINSKIKNNYSPSPFRRPSPDTLTVSPSLRRCAAFDSPVSDSSAPPGEGLTPNKRRRTLDVSDDVVESLKKHFPASPTSIEDVADKGIEQLIDSSPTSEAKADMRVSDSLQDAFAELEFKKAFLILNYSGGEKLENVITAERIRSLSMLEMSRFEFHIWNDFGRRICKENERRKYLDLGSGTNLAYHCHVYEDGSYSFKGPFFNKTTTLLHKAIGDENVINVKLLEVETESSEPVPWSVMSCPAFNKIAEEGIFIGQKKYQFFVFKDGGKEEKKSPASCPVKCYFINLEAFRKFFDDGRRFFPGRTIQDARSIFMHIREASSVANYMARFSLILSKTVTLDVNLNDVTVQDIDDVPCLDEDGKPLRKEDGKFHILTDGTGFISEDLALKCPQNCFKGSVPHENNIKSLLVAVPNAKDLTKLSLLKSHYLEPPLLIQFRMFHQGRAIKGTVLVNRMLPEKTIQVRPSMIKIRTAENLAGAPTLNKFEIVGTSNKPKRPRLSKNLIALLHYGGVPKEYFLEKLDDALKDVQSILNKKRAALKVAISRDADDDSTVARMILSGLPLDEPFLQHRLSVIAKAEMKNLKAGKIPISNSFYVMGTADPTKTLNCGEVCVILDHGQISGPVLVYRNPGIHPGDIHVVNARYVKALEEIVGNAKYGIFFPSKGPRSMADEIAGGDYDGDMYWVSRDPELPPKFKPSPPWRSCPSSPISSSKKVKGLSDGALERELFHLYLKSRFQPSKAVGVAADCWLVYMDRLLTLKDENSGEKECVMQKILKLIDRYYDALDAPKTGIKIEIPPNLMPVKFPHHMERGECCTYHSNSVLGDIYDKVDKYNSLDPDNLDPDNRVWKLPYFEEQIKLIPTEYQQKWWALYDEYKGEMTAALKAAGDEYKNEFAVAVYRLYKRKLYGTGPEDGADELDNSQKSWEELRFEALAVYNAAYECAIRENVPQKCNFAWKVAGSALFKILMDEQGEKPICCAPSVLHEVFR